MHVIITPTQDEAIEAAVENYASALLDWTAKEHVDKDLFHLQEKAVQFAHDALIHTIRTITAQQVSKAVQRAKSAETPT